MFLAAAERLAQEVTKEDLAVGSVFPRTIDTLGDTARSVGVAVVRRKQDGVVNLDRNVSGVDCRGDSNEEDVGVHHIENNKKTRDIVLALFLLLFLLFLL